MSRSWQVQTKEFLGLDEPVNCMSYFPVLIQAKHLHELRQFVEKKHGKSFDQVFYTLLSRWGARFYSQFSVICTFLYWLKHDEYIWYIHNASPNWDMISPPPTPGQYVNKNMFNAQNSIPKPYIATHMGLGINSCHAMQLLIYLYVFD